MHKTIIEQQQGRITLEFLLERRHFFGVGAFERREGEISIFDSKAVVTSLAVMACPLS
jgi:alpha-acetolactate decarboxylase